MTTGLAQRLAAVRQRIDDARRRRGGDAEVILVGVGKRHSVERLSEALAAGLRDFGENYAQELRDKRRALDETARWHFIGPVQANKVKYVVGNTVLVHTVDRPELIDAIERRAQNHGVHQDVLVQVNIAHETGKSGVAPDHLPALLDRFAHCDHVHCRGLMLIPPHADPEATRPHFTALRRLRDDLAQQTRPNVELHHLSMGMSDDFEVAIEEGATIVRVGTAIFGLRPG